MNAFHILNKHVLTQLIKKAWLGEVMDINFRVVMVLKVAMHIVEVLMITWLFMEPGARKMK